MSNRMDQLFKNKLGEHRQPPSTEAWSKIEAGLSKKNNTVILWRAAAVFALVGILFGSLVYWQSGKEDNNQLVTEKAIEPPPTIKDTLLVQPEQSDTKALASAKKSTHIKNEKVSVRFEKQEEVKEMPSETSIGLEAELVLAQALVTEPLQLAEKPIVIEFTLAPLPSTAQVTQAKEVEKSNGFMKVLDKALDLKNGEGDLGLRDAKNELFALNFRKDKTKRN